MSDNADLNKKIGRLLKEARRSDNITQDEMADAAGVSKNHLSEIERGVCRCGVPVLLAYCEKLDMTPDELLGIKTAPDIDPELLAGISAMSPPRQRGALELLRLIGWI